MQESNFLNDMVNQFNTGETSLADFFINIFLTIVLSYVIGLIYAKYGNSLSNRKKLTQTFVLIAVTVMLVISIVKSSLALSLGLVGALSIVRFRTAIKEPEELVYFFIAIAIGLGLGANQRVITLLGAVVMMLYIVIQNRKAVSKMMRQNLVLSVSNSGSESLDEAKILEIIGRHSSRVELRRMDQTDGFTELSLHVEFQNMDQIMAAKKDLQQIGNIRFSFMETY